MADNVLITSGAGTSIATDDIGGVQYQRVKVTFGADGAASDVQSGTGLPVDTELPAAAAMGDAVANPTVPNVAANNVVYSGSAWDRLRTVVAANGNTGTGLMGAGIMGYDGAAYRRLLADTTGLLAAQPTPGTTGGWSVSSQTALTNTAVAVKAAAGTFGGYVLHNPAAATTYLQVFNVASGSVVLGTTAPTYVVGVPAGASVAVEFTCGIGHATAIAVAATTTATGSTAPATALVAALLYK